MKEMCILCCTYGLVEAFAKNSFTICESLVRSNRSAFKAASA